jgi:hypothetical protein
MNKNMGFNELREEKDKIIKKWKDSGLLDGLEGTVDKNHARLFESYLVCFIDDDKVDDFDGIKNKVTEACRLLQSIDISKCDECKGIIDASDLHDINMKLSNWVWYLDKKK